MWKVEERGRVNLSSKESCELQGRKQPLGGALSVQQRKRESHAVAFILQMTWED